MASIIPTFGHCQWHQYAPYSTCVTCGWTTDGVLKMNTCGECGAWRDFQPAPEPQVLVELHAV